MQWLRKKIWKILWKINKEIAYRKRTKAMREADPFIYERDE